MTHFKVKKHRKYNKRNFGDAEKKTGLLEPKKIELLKLECHTNLKACNRALAHKESQWKLLEVQISESRSPHDNSFLV